MPQPSVTTTFLKSVSLFAGLDEPSLALLARLSHTRSLAKGQVLFAQHDPGDAAYAVRSGCIAITLSTEDGRELVINEMRRGDCFGELALVTGQPRSASAVAAEASELVVIPRVDFMREVEEQPSVLRELLQLLGRRLAASSEREGALAFLQADARIARLVLDIEREQHANGLITVSQEELAQRVGVTRQSVAKTLGQWRRAHWIITGRGHIMLLNRAALRKCARQSQGP